MSIPTAGKSRSALRIPPPRVDHPAFVIGVCLFVLAALPSAATYIVRSESPGRGLLEFLVACFALLLFFFFLAGPSWQKAINSIATLSTPCLFVYCVQSPPTAIPWTIVVLPLVCVLIIL